MDAQVFLTPSISLATTSDRERQATANSKRPPATAKSITKRPRTTSDREQQATPKFMCCFVTTDFLCVVLLPAAPHIWQNRDRRRHPSGVLYFYRIIYFYNGFFNFENFSHKTSTQRKILRNYQKSSRILIKIENMYAYDYFSLFLKNVRDSH